MCNKFPNIFGIRSNFTFCDNTAMDQLCHDDVTIQTQDVMRHTDAAPAASIFTVLDVVMLMAGE